MSGRDEMIALEKTLGVTIISSAGFLITNVLCINQYPDFEADRACNKMNWVVRLGRKRAQLTGAAMVLAGILTRFFVYH